MNRLAELYELTIFVTVPGEQRVTGKAGWWSNAPRSQHIPSSFARALLLTIDAALLVVAGPIGFMTPAPLITIVGLELHFLGACVLLSFARILKRFSSVVGVYLAVFGIGVILKLVFPDKWGSFYLFMLCFVVFYRFPPRWALPFAVLCILTLIATHRTVPLLPSPHSGGCVHLTRDPDRLAVKLEEMAALLRESITESRRVVGLLREPLYLHLAAQCSTH